MIHIAAVHQANQYQYNCKCKLNGIIISSGPKLGSKSTTSMDPRSGSSFTRCMLNEIIFYKLVSFVNLFYVSLC